MCKTRTVSRSSAPFCLLPQVSGDVALAWQVAFSQLVLCRLPSLHSRCHRPHSPTVFPMTCPLQGQYLPCPFLLRGTSPLLGLSLAASCSAALFPSTCNVSPIWCICLLNLWFALPATLSHLSRPAWSLIWCVCLFLPPQA